MKNALLYSLLSLTDTIVPVVWLSTVVKVAFWRLKASSVNCNITYLTQEVEHIQDRGIKVVTSIVFQTSAILAGIVGSMRACRHCGFYEGCATHM